MNQIEKEIALAQANAYKLLQRRLSIHAKRRWDRYRNPQLKSVGNSGIKRVKPPVFQNARRAIRFDQDSDSR